MGLQLLDQLRKKIWGCSQLGPQEIVDEFVARGAASHMFRETLVARFSSMEGRELRVLQTEHHTRDDVQNENCSRHTNDRLHRPVACPMV